MNAPDAGSAAAVTKPRNCDRIVFTGKDKPAIKRKERLVTKLIDNRHLRTWCTTSAIFTCTAWPGSQTTNCEEMGAKQQPPLRMKAGRPGFTCSRMGAGSSTTQGGIFAFWRTVCRKSTSSSTTTLRPRLTSKVAAMGSAASLRTPRGEARDLIIVSWGWTGW